MPSTFVATRAQLILAICIPVAVLIGFFLAEPLRLGNVAVLGMVAATLTFPLVIRWHHPLLVLSWNAAITPAFLPGSPPLWLLLAFVSFLVVLMSRSVRERSPVNHVASVTMPLIVLLGVVLVTAALTGGVGIRSLGGASYGGKGYVFILASVVGYFALASQPIRTEQARLYAGMFFLSGLTALIPNLAYLGGQAFWWLFYIVPPLFAMEQAKGDMALNAQMVRIYGFGPSSLALLSWLLARYGIRGVFVWQRPWRMLFLLVALVGCLYSGFRSVLIIAGLICLFQFYFEGLYRTRYAFVIGALVLLSIPLLLARPASLPLVIQRTLSFLPIDVSPVARESAQMSTNWRIQMWREVLPEVPRHLLLGKGYAIDPNELNMALESTRRGYGESRTAQTVGSYHNGPLSVLITFGFWGMAAFLWFLGSSIRYLHQNCRHGNPALRRINTLLLSLFVAKSVFFLLVFGMFYVDLPIFAGLVGFAVCVNGRGGGSVSGSTTRLVKRNQVNKAVQNGDQPGVPESSRSS